jgi:hypothetical protein
MYRRLTIIMIAAILLCVPQTSFAQTTESAPNWIYHATTFTAILVLVALYFFGVWLRTYVIPAQGEMPVSKQLLASIPVGLLTMTAYAKTAFPGVMLAGDNMPYDAMTMLASAILFGMLSRESLDRLLKSAPNVPVPEINRPT